MASKKESSGSSGEAKETKGEREEISNPVRVGHYDAEGYYSSDGNLRENDQSLVTEPTEYYNEERAARLTRRGYRYDHINDALQLPDGAPVNTDGEIQLMRNSGPSGECAIQGGKRRKKRSRRKKGGRKRKSRKQKGGAYQEADTCDNEEYKWDDIVEYNELLPQGAELKDGFAGKRVIVKWSPDFVHQNGIYEIVEAEDDTDEGPAHILLIKESEGDNGPLYILEKTNLDNKLARICKLILVAEPEGGGKRRKKKSRRKKKKKRKRKSRKHRYKHTGGGNCKCCNCCKKRKSHRRRTRRRRRR